LKKWILDIDVTEVFKGSVKDESIKVKCGTLNIIFGDEKVDGGEFILMLLDKSGWQKEYTLIGAQAPQENVTYWLRRQKADAE